MDCRILIQVNFMSDLSRSFSIRVWPQLTVSELKHMIHVYLTMPVNQQVLSLRLIDGFLQDDQTIDSYGLHDGQVVYLFRKGEYVFRRIVPPIISVRVSAATPAPVGGSSTSVTGCVKSLGFRSGNSASLSPGLDGTSEAPIPGILINIQYSRDTRFAIRLSPELTVREVKGLINQHQHIHVNEQCLMYSGQFLRDNQTIGSYGLEDGHVIHLARPFVQPACSGRIFLLL